MPTFKKRLELEFTRSIRLFFHLETGLTSLGETVSRFGSRRGAKQGPEKPAAEAPAGESQTEPPQQSGKVVAEQQEKLAAQNQKLKCARQQLARKDQELARKDQELAEAERELAQAKSTAPSEDSSNEVPSVFFIVGQAKSGTSWLMNTLDSHPDRVGKTVEEGAKLFGDSYTEVRYEDLLERPHEEVGELARFLGADASEEAIEQAVSSASFEKSTKGRERGQEDTSSFFRKGIAGDWKNYFTERDKQIFKEEAGDLLIRLGYEEDYDW